jgi:alanine racemase
MALVKSWVEISSARLVANLRAVQAAAGEGVETLAVVKANGYGHEAPLVAQALTAAGLHWLGVSDVDEGARVRKAVGDATRILVMCGMELDDAPAMVAHSLTPVVWTGEHIEAIERAAAAADRRVAVHLEIDTGMARQGVALGPELDSVLQRLAESQWVQCEGVMSHLSSAEVSASSLTESQRKKFAEALRHVLAAGLKPVLLHLGNTSAVDEGSIMQWVRDTAARIGARPMIRTGLAVYGYALPLEDGTANLAAALQPILQWKTRVIGLREIQPGATVGYGATFTADAPMRLALLPVGYADGFRREASSGVGNGWVIIAGIRAPVVGRVSMSLTTVDVTHLPTEVGDEVILLGEGVSAHDHARWCATIPYEILCGIRAHFELR